MAKAEDAVTRATRLLGRLVEVEYQHRDGSCPEPPAGLESSLEPLFSALLSGDDYSLYTLTLTTSNSRVHVMAAILTPTNLTILEHPALKHPPSAVEPTCPLPPLPTCLTWSAETNSVYVSSATSGILQYDLASGSLQDVSMHDQIGRAHV